MRSRFWIIPDRRDLTASGRRWLERLVCRKAVQGLPERGGDVCLPIVLPRWETQLLRTLNLTLIGKLVDPV